MKMHTIFGTGPLIVMKRRELQLYVSVFLSMGLMFMTFSAHGLTFNVLTCSLSDTA